MQNQKKRRKLNSADAWEWAIIIVLVLLGLVTVFSASAPSSLAETNNSYSYVIKQAVFAVLGFGLCYLLSRFDYNRYNKFGLMVFLYFLALACTLSVLVPGMGRTVNGARRWITLGPIQSFQPSEGTKICLMMALVIYLQWQKDKLDSTWYGTVLPLALIGGQLIVLYVIQNHLSACIIIGLTTIVLLFVSLPKRKVLAGLCCFGLVVAALIAMNYLSGSKSSFRGERLKVYLDPWSDALGTGYQPIHSRYAIASGGLFGAGLGNSTQKYKYIPEPENDFIFAIYAEEMGFAGCVIVIALFSALIHRGLKIAGNAKNSFGTTLAIGIISIVGIQILLNIGVVTTIIPTTGISLPFFSYGGTSLVVLLASMGILLNISRDGNEKKEVIEN